MVGTLSAVGWAGLGHLALGIVVINRVHGLGIRHRRQKRLDLIWCLWQIGLPIAALAALFQRHFQLPTQYPWLVAAYLLVSQGILLWVIAGWVVRVCQPTPTCLLEDRVRRVPLASHPPGQPRWAADRLTRWLERVPGNQIFELAVHEKRLQLHNLPAAWEGLRIAHLSDLHMTGQIEPDFFHAIVDRTNAGQPDLIAITGDIVDKNQCIPWLIPTLGRLRSPLGCWYVLGNHDQRVTSIQELQRTLMGAGLRDLGGKTEVIWRADEPLLLAGNQLPWFTPAPSLEQSRRTDPRLARAFTLALSHSPDQIGWAQTQQVDLLLAGHTHGGQVRLPCLGPILSPSLYGVRFASGTFFCHPTVMHVSRGLSGTRPIRIRCAPELAFLTLNRSD